MSKLTYGDFYATGRQDCGNVLRIDDFADNVLATDLSYPTNVAAEKIFDRSWNKDEDDIREGWMEQADREEIEADDLDVDKCFKEWAAGWKSCALRHIEQHLTEHRSDIMERLAAQERRRRAPGSVVYWIGDDEEVETVELNTFEAALEEIATRLVRQGGYDALSIFFGDDDGPHETLARVELAEVAENAEAHAASAELVVTLDAVHHVPTRLIDVARASHVVTLEYGPTRGRRRDQSIVYVQLGGELEHDATALRFAALEFNPKKRNPGKLKGLTAKGNKMYHHVLAAIGMRAEAQKRGAPRAAAKAIVGAARHGVPGLMRKNPEVSPEERAAAVDRYKTFHRFDPKDIGVFPSSFSIPAKMRCIGDAVFTTYRSGKVDPSTLKLPKKPVNYIHHHDAGVEIYVPTSDREFGTDGKVVSVPSEFRDVGALTMLGQSLGFCAKTDDDGELECEHDDPLPELYCTADGKCLLIIQDKREVLAMIWGGALGVFARGIDG